MDVGTLEQWLWAAACEVRGPLDAPKFKDYILPIIFLKGWSDLSDEKRCLWFGQDLLNGSLTMNLGLVAWCVTARADTTKPLRLETLSDN